MKQFVFANAITGSLVLFVLGVFGQAGGGKASPFKPILSADAYRELTARSIHAIEAAAKSGDKDAADTIRREAVLLAAYTLSVKNAGADDVATLRGAALEAAKSADKNAKWANFALALKAAPKAAPIVKDWTPYVPELDGLMIIFKKKSKGGDGLHADLQYQPKLANLNGIEALIGSLSAKKLTDANMNKVAKELPNLGYRMAVVASVTHELAPRKGAGQWRALADNMRDASIALAEAAQKKNAAGVFTAAQALESSCTQCHSVYKKN